MNLPSLSLIAGTSSLVFTSKFSLEGRGLKYSLINFILYSYSPTRMPLGQLL